MSDPVGAIEADFRIKLPPRHRAALLDASDPIHGRSILLGLDGDGGIPAVNRAERAAAWRQWPDHLVAFAYDGCGGLFAYDTREEPYRVYYIDPMETAPESVAGCEAEGFVSPSFDAWYAEQLAEED